MKLKGLFAVILIAITFVACSSDDDYKTSLDLSEIPVEIMDFVDTHFEGISIIRAIQEDDKNAIVYKLYLEGHLELEFNEVYEIIEIDGHTKLPDSVIPAPILEYVSIHYSNNVITDWELKRNTQEVGLDNNVDLIFDLEGNFIKIDND